MLTCRQRDAIREHTLESFRATDWTASPCVEVAPDATATQRQHSMSIGVVRLLQRALEQPAHFILFLEDDLRFNYHLRHNLERWLELLRAQPDDLFFATLFNPSGPSIGDSAIENTYLVNAKCAFGSQALLLSTATAQHMVQHWDEDVEEHHDFKMYALAASVCPIYCHTPSLVQHMRVPSTWSGPSAYAPDFVCNWRAP